MFPAKTIVAAVCIATICAAAERFPQYELVDLGLPSDTFSHPTDINDGDELIGTLGRAPNDRGFLWRDGKLTLLRGFEGQSAPRDINNHGVIVGNSRSNNIQRAWLWSNGADRDLGAAFDHISSADSINDVGDVIGTVDNFNSWPAVYLFSDPPRRLTHDFAIALGGQNDGSIAARAINNNGFVVESFFGTAILHTNLDERAVHHYLTPPSPLVAARTEGFALNASNHVAGAVSLHSEYSQPGIWTPGGWTTLAAPLSCATVAHSLNDHGAAVGTRIGPIPTGLPYPPVSTAMLWQGSNGIDLNHITTLPAGARLTRAVAINNAGNIAAELFENGRARAVLLRRTKPGELPSLSLTGVEERMYESNTIKLGVATTYKPSAGARVLFSLWRRELLVSPLEFNGYRRTFALAAPRQIFVDSIAAQACFAELEPGAYLAQAEIEDSNGMLISSVPVVFGVLGSAGFGSPRLTWNRELNVPVNVGHGATFRYEESEDFLVWKPLAGGPTGSRILQTSTRNQRGFIRAVRVEGSIDFHPTHVELALAPATITNYVLEVDAPEGPITIDPSADGTFTATGYQLAMTRGTYTYTPLGIHAHLLLEGSDFPRRVAWIELEIEARTDFDFEEGPPQRWVYSGAARGEAGAFPRPFRGTFTLRETGGEPGVGPGSLPAPDSLREIYFTQTLSGTGPAVYTVVFSGGRAGTFNTTGGSVGHGTYTYLPTGTTARLVLNFIDFPGDTDEFDLVFHTPPWANTLRGTQRINGEILSVEGSFTYLPGGE